MPTTPNGVWTPDDSDDWDLVTDLAAMAVSIDNAFGTPPASFLGTEAERAALAAPKLRNGVTFRTTDTNITYHRSAGSWRIAPGTLLGSFETTGTGNISGTSGTVVGGVVVSSVAVPVGQPLALQWPVRGDILRRFGPVGMGERNNGINIGASAGTEVKASADGTVAYVGDDIVGQGLTVLIVHRDGWRTVYGHLGSATVRDGAQVRAGQAIGTVGLTAGDGRPSIHYEVRQMRGDDPVALDPLTVLPR